jgi:hypothetical protein
MKPYTILIERTIYKDNEFNAELTGNHLAKQIDGTLINIKDGETNNKRRKESIQSTSKLQGCKGNCSRNM